MEKLNIKRAVLSSIGIAGLLLVTALAPNAIQALKVFGVGKKKRNTKHYLNTVVSRLIRDKMIKLEFKGDSKYFSLTELGEKRLAKYELQDFSEKKFPKWDGKWRVIIFDIKEYVRSSRDQLRITLLNVGFVKLQKSVWVFPHDCEEFVFLLKTNFELGKNVLYMTVERLENDNWLRKIFGLPRLSS